jgi:RNA polymerase-interacting CarD/CdnL/TRCF family regulator
LIEHGSEKPSKIQGTKRDNKALLPSLRILKTAQFAKDLYRKAVVNHDTM